VPNWDTDEIQRLSCRQIIGSVVDRPVNVLGRHSEMFVVYSNDDVYLPSTMQRPMSAASSARDMPPG
jgi:hypothetical protein